MRVGGKPGAETCSWPVKSGLEIGDKEKVGYMNGAVGGPSKP